MEHECISSNTSFRPVCFGETTIDYHQFSVGTYGLLTHLRAHWYMPIDDVAMLPFHTESIKQTVAHSLIIAQLVIPPFYLFVRLFVFYEITFKSCHFVLVKCRRVFAAPQVPNVIESKRMFLGIVATEICLTHQVAHLVKQVFSTILFTANFFVE